MKDLDDIEVLDIFEIKKRDLKKEKKMNTNEEPTPNMSRGNRKRKLKVRSFQILFCVVSALFILGCCIFYGSRLIKYYKIYNPKASDGSKIVLLSNKITSYSEIVYEDSGLYINSGNYIYKGDVSNNYIKYSNMLWRILRINTDGTIQIILDDYINVLNWNKEIDEFSKSDINKYLNEVFIEALNKDLLIKSSFCTDKVEDLSNITCDKQNSDNYVTLLDVMNYLNSMVDKKTFLSSDEEIFWLSDYGNDKVWHTNGSSVSQSEALNFYEVRPVVTLKGTISYTSGDGSIGDPYNVDSDNNLTFGSIVKLGEDNWVVYEVSDNIKLMRVDILEKQYRFDKEKITFDPTSSNSLAEYLNTTYLNSLDYKDLLKEEQWYIGSFKDSYTDIKADKVKAKVGIPNLIDIKLFSEKTGYFLSTNDNEKYMYVYGEIMRSSRPSIYKGVRPCIAISKDIKIENGKGTMEEPFKVEA